MDETAKPGLYAGKPLRFWLSRQPGLEQAVEAENVIRGIADPAAVPELLQALAQVSEREYKSAKLRSGEFAHCYSDSLYYAMTSSKLEAISDALCNFQDMITPELEGFLKSENAYLRAYAARTLGRAGNRAAIPELISALEHPQTRVCRFIAENALLELGEPAVAALTALLGSGAEGRRRAASEALSVLCSRASYYEQRPHELEGREPVREAVEALAGPGVSAALIRALTDDDGDVRKNSVDALGCLERPEAVPVLLQALNDGDAEVQYEAALGLGRIGHHGAVGALIAVTRDSGRDGWVRRRAIDALVEIGAPEAFQPLAEALRYSDPNLRFAALGICQFEDARAVKVISESLLREEHWFVRHAAAGALHTMLGDRDAIIALYAGVQRARDEGLDEAAAGDLMADKSDAEAAALLAAAAGHESRQVRLASVTLLDVIGKPFAAQALARLGNDPDEEVRKAVETAIRLRRSHPDEPH